MLRCTAVHTHSSMVMIHVVKMSKVPRVFGLGFQCTRSVPLPNTTELILGTDAWGDFFFVQALSDIYRIEKNTERHFEDKVSRGI